MRNYQTPNERGKKEQKYGFARGTTRWTKEQIREMIVQEGESMIFETFSNPSSSALHKLCN
jgi:hypothetical protein